MLESPIVLTEGSVIERLRRDPGVQLHSEVLHSLFSSTRAGREALERLFREYLDIGLGHSLPLLGNGLFRHRLLRGSSHSGQHYRKKH